MFKYLLIISSALLLCGCYKYNDYAMAYQLPPIRFPANSMPVSHRYDIPPVYSTNCQIITQIQPPYYDAVAENVDGGNKA